MSRNKRSVGSSRVTLKAMATPAALLALLLAAAPSAQAKVQPNPEFLPFADCPTGVKHVGFCLVATTTGGEFKLGSKTVQITKPIVMQGGLIEGSHVLVPATDGNTLSRSTFTVPGGLTGIEGLPLGGEVLASTELAGPIEVFEENLTDGRGPAVKLPVKVKLENPTLGEECYVGSEAEPIVLELTTGTTKPPSGTEPISGNPGTVGLNPAQNIVTISGASLVDNTFAVPGVTGCGGVLSPLLDAAVDVEAGLPASPGTSRAILTGTLAETNARAVKKAKVAARRPKTKT